MNKPSKIDTPTTRLYQWVSDGDCAELELPPALRYVIEVRGDLTEPVVLLGGLTVADVPLETVRVAPAIVEIPHVRLLKPVAPAGVTITVLGVK